MQVKASYTVEAALIMPIICFILIGIIILTLDLYKQVENFSIEQQEKMKMQHKTEAVLWIRIEKIIKE